STSEKKRILINNIFCVDIDSQAVEVTKLSLLLKAMEGETDASIKTQLMLFNERVLPSLENNIKCGNSLIGPDFYDGQLELEPREERKIKPFDWKEEFKEVFAHGGFDCVIGNPPYLRIQGLQENYKNQIEYFIQKYKSAVKRFDLYILFLEKGFNLLKKDGLLGYICPHKFINSDFGSGIREFFIQSSAPERFISFGNNLIFEQAATYTGIFILSKNDNQNFYYYEFPNLKPSDIKNNLENLKEHDFTEYNTSYFTKNQWILTCSSVQNILNKIKQSFTLGQVFENILQGVVTGADDIYFLKKISNKEDKIVEVFSIEENSNIKIEKEILKPMLKGENVKRYKYPDFNYYCIYPYKIENNKTKILEEKELSLLYPLAYEYLKKYKNELKDLRIKFKTNPKYWYSCHRSRDMNLFEKNRIITPYLSLGCNMTLSKKGIYHNTKVYSLIPNQKFNDNLFYWLGIFNSKLMWWFIKNTSSVFRGGYFTFSTDYLYNFPIKIIDFSNPEDKSMHNEIVKNVDIMLSLNKELNETKLPDRHMQIESRIKYTDKKIDSLVYKLYNLTEDEIKIVEGEKQ
ncbi:MAG: Eco57I restriction-modification methylase domain-containing protein, partial [Candidatus Sumerlaeota bacterium]|nr:Eco57I restriction-modification methylase domain-containing protein [Candidatus Sumerlaeota bacterium]